MSDFVTEFIESENQLQSLSDKLSYNMSSIKQIQADIERVRQQIDNSRDVPSIQLTRKDADDEVKRKIADL